MSLRANTSNIESVGRTSGAGWGDHGRSLSVSNPGNRATLWNAERSSGPAIR